MLILCLFNHLIRDGDLLYRLGSSSRRLRKGYILPLSFRIVANQVLRIYLGTLFGKVKVFGLLKRRTLQGMGINSVNPISVTS